MCVAWAPLVGRAYHLLATGSRDGRVRVFKVIAPPPLLGEGAANEGAAGIGGVGTSTAMVPAGGAAAGGASWVGTWSEEEVANFDEHGTAVVKVEWNLTGCVHTVGKPPLCMLISTGRTILASSGHDGRVRLWKASYSNIWRPMGYVTAEEQDDGPAVTKETVDEGMEY